MKTFLQWLDVHKAYLCLMLGMALQVATANHWFVVPADVMNELAAFAGGAGFGLIPHSTAAVLTKYLGTCIVHENGRQIN